MDFNFSRQNAIVVIVEAMVSVQDLIDVQTNVNPEIPF